MNAPHGYRFQVARPAHAERLLRFGRYLLGETDGFLRTPEERAANADEMAGVIRGFEETADALLLNAWTDAPDPEIVGEAVLVPGRLARTRHTATVGVGVLKAHWGRGLGRALMTAIEDRARNGHIRRLELTVIDGNARARHLYESLGYREEGIKRQSVVLPGRGAVDEIMMAKLLHGGEASAALD